MKPHKTMGKITTLILISGFGLLIAGCSGSNKITNSENQAPIITALEVSPEEAQAGELVIVSSQAFDPEGEKIDFDWSAIFGYFTGYGQEVQYHTEGCCLGLNEITLTTTDASGKSSQRKIWVDISK
jgi:hypothetical protein